MKKWIILLIVFMLVGCEQGPDKQQAGDNGTREGLGDDSESAVQNNPSDRSTETPQDGFESIRVHPEQIRTGLLVLVNKEHKLDEQAIPNDIIELYSHPEVRRGYSLLDDTIRLSRHVAEAFGDMAEAAAEDGVNQFMISSGYRDMTEQDEMYRVKGGDYALPSGYSEHNLGLALDIGSTRMPIEHSPEGKWLARHAASYGFILRYPQNKTEITGIQYEPWHFRYVGLPHSLIMERLGFTLEEYLEFLKEETSYESEAGGRQYEIRYVPVPESGARLSIPKEDRYELSGDNMDGVIVTILRGGANRP